MANFTRQRSSGLWVSASAVLPAEFEGIDVIRPKLINATDGSTHAPSAPIIIGGTGITMDGPLTIGSGATLTVGASASIEIDANGSGTFVGPVLVSDLTMAGGGAYAILPTPVLLTQQLATKAKVTAWDTFNTINATHLAGVGLLNALIIPLDMPHDIEINAIELTVKAAAGHGGVMPDVPMSMSFHKNAHTTGTGSQIGATIYDPSANTTAYEAVHQFVKSGLSEVVNRGAYRYFAILYPESGGTANVGTIHYSTLVTATLTSINVG